MSTTIPEIKKFQIQLVWDKGHDWIPRPAIYTDINDAKKAMRKLWALLGEGEACRIRLMRIVNADTGERAS